MQLNLARDATTIQTIEPGRITQSRASPAAHQVVARSSPEPPQTSVDIYHEIISMVILPLPLIQEEYVLVNRLERLSLPRNSVVRLTVATA